MNRPTHITITSSRPLSEVFLKGVRESSAEVWGSSAQKCPTVLRRTLPDFSAEVCRRSRQLYV